MSDNFFYDLNKRLQQVVDAPKSEHKQLNEGAVAEAGYSAKAARAGKDIGKPGKNFEKIAKSASERYGSKAAGERVAGAVLNKLRHPKEDVEEGMLDSLKNVGKKIAGGINRAVGHGSDEAMLKDLQKKMGVPPTGKKPVGEEYGPMEGGAPMTAKQKKFAKLAPPADKITFADKIAGAKKEVDEMLGDVAADAIKKAVTSKGGKVTASKGVTKHHAGPGVYGGGEPDVHPLDRLKGPSKKQLTGKEETDEGSDWSQLGKEYSRPKIGSVTHGHKHDIEHTATGQRVTRRTDPNTGHSVGAEDDAPAAGEKRGRGRPKGTGKSMGAKGPSGKSKLMTKEADHDQSEVKAAMALLKKAGYKVEKAEQELDEKAVSKKQQKFMGMVHAAQKGEKPASKEVAKVAKTMKKSDAEDFASTKHKGLPEKKKPEGKKKEKTEEAGGTSTPTASSGFSYGKGIYDSMNRELEKMIAESMSINMSDSTEGGKSLTVTATDEDAMSLAAMLQNAGIGGEHEHAEVGGDETCDTCGSHDCGCGDIEEAVTENEPNWPTDDVTSDDALQYSGGLNGPKSTGQTTVPVIANQGDRTGVDDETLSRLREMAGVQSELKPWERTMKEEAEEKLDEVFPDPATIAGSLALGGALGAVKGRYDDMKQRERGATAYTPDSEIDKPRTTMQRIRAAAGLPSKNDPNVKEGELDEQEQVMAVEEAQEMCEVCEAVPCKCDESVEESIARFRSLAGIAEDKKVEEDDVEEGNKFTGELAKARAAGKEEADLDGDGDLEKVRESVSKMTNLWKAYKG